MADWRVFGASARPSGKSEKGTCGGVTAVVSPSLHFRPCALVDVVEGADPHAGYGVDWMAYRLCYKGTSVVFVLIYVTACV
eukprot:14427090-Alexandrium_andersonii.AAC.1